MTMQARRLTDHFVAEITGLEGLRLDDPAVFAQLREAMVEHQVLVLRNQRLSPDQLVRFGRLWGELRTEMPHPSLPRFNELAPISNDREWGHLGVGTKWHSDGMFLPRRSRFSMLYAHQPARSGGETLFCNTYRAHDELPADLRETIANRTAVHMTRNVAPMCLVHPDTQRKALYLNFESTMAIRGLPLSESLPLLDRLEEHISRADFGYRHTYCPGDLVICDGFSTLHRVTPGVTEGLRILYRVATLSEGPMAA
jgi:taurine dioxygenase